MEIFRVIYGEKTGALACLVHSLIIYVNEKRYSSSLLLLVVVVVVVLSCHFFVTISVPSLRFTLLYHDGRLSKMLASKPTRFPH